MNQLFRTFVEKVNILVNHQSCSTHSLYFCFRKNIYLKKQPYKRLMQVFFSVGV